MGLKPHERILIGVGIGLLVLTCSVYLFENYSYSGDHLLTGRFIGSRNSGSPTVLCYMEFSDGNKIWVPLHGISNETVTQFTGKNVLIHYSQTVTGKCGFLSISEVT
jgi:hypothetical protein